MRFSKTAYGVALLAALPLTLLAQSFTFNRIIQSGDVIPNGNAFTALSGYGTGSDGRVFFGGAVSADPSTAAWFSSSGGTTQFLFDYASVAPGTSEVFTTIAPVGVDGNSLYFSGMSATTSGIYYHDGSTLQALYVQGAAAPGGGNFWSFGSNRPFASGGTVAFVASIGAVSNSLVLAQGGSGIRLFGVGDTVAGHAAAITNFSAGSNTVGNDGGNVAVTVNSGSGEVIIGYSSGGGALKLANFATAAPGGSGNFTDFGSYSPTVDGSVVYFMGTHAGGSGIYSVDIAGGPVSLIADTSMAAPGAGGNFTSFSYLAADSGRLVFLGHYSGGYGVFAYDNHTFYRVAGTGDTLDGRTVAGISFNLDSLTGDELLIEASFGAGQVAVFSTAIPEPGTYALIVGVAVLAGAAWRRIRKDGAAGRFY